MVSHYDTSILYSSGGRSNGGGDGSSLEASLPPREQSGEAAMRTDRASISSASGNGINSNPPQGVFEMMAVMELEQRSITGHDTQSSLATEDDQNHDHDDGGFSDEDDEEYLDPDTTIDDSFDPSFEAPDANEILRPTFDSKGKFKDYETRVVEDNLWEEDDDGIGSTDKSTQPKKCRNKHYAFVLIPLLFIVGIVAIILRTGGKKGGDSSAAPEPTNQDQDETLSSTKIDLSKYGYPHIKDSARGFISWPPEFDENSFDDFDSSNGVTSLEECAAKCQTLGTYTGSWSDERQSCWCYQVALDNICMEPCIENDFIDFSVVTLPNIRWCTKSICDKDWYYSKEYCDVDLKFDQADCDAKIEALGSSSVSKPVASPTEISSIPDANDATTDMDLSEYGYFHTHTKDSAGGFISWPPEFDEDALDDFGPSDGVTSLAECAAKCQILDTPTGGWNEELKSCWCNYIDVKNICMDPCIENDHIDFSRVPLSLSDVGWCEKSLCDWYYDFYREDFCDVADKYDKAACDAKIETISSTPSSTTVDLSEGKETAIPTFSPTVSPVLMGHLSEYGYDYTDDNAVGWITWPPEFEDNTKVDDFGSGDGITSLEECAAKCQVLNTPTGAWSAKFETCRCYYHDVANICKEPCIENDYIDFSKNVPFSDISWCEKSLCDKDWYFSEDYCNVDVKFDKDACDAKVDALSKLHITPSASAYIRKATPNEASGPQPLRVERDESISFILFDLSGISDEDVISKAMLNLQMKTHVNAIPGSIDVAHIYAGDWTDDDSVTWNNPPKENIANYVTSFDVGAFPYNATTHLIEVDVTSAIKPGYDEITFKLSTQSTGIWWFASEKGDDAGPELVISLDT